MRHIPPSMSAELEGSQIRPAWLVELEFSNGFVWIWSGKGYLHWRGRQFVNGQSDHMLLGSISNVDENGEGKAGGITYSISGIPPTSAAGRDLIAQADKWTRQGGTVRLWFATLDTNFALDGDPWPIAETLIDVPLIRMAPDGVTVSISTETRLSRQQSRQGRRYTHEDQQLDYPGDLGFQYVNELQDKSL